MTPRPRIDLASAIPLSSPLAMWVEPTNVCNFKCTFCPEAFADYGKQAGYYEKMSYNTWHKVWFSLQKWPALKALRLYHVGEPLLNPILPDMIADGRTVADRVEIVTNGSLLAKRAKELVQAGLDDCWVSVYGVDAKTYKDVTGAWSLLKVLDGILALKQARGASHKPRILAQLVMENPSTETADRFRAIFSDADQCVVRDYLHNWGGSDSRLVQLGQKLEPKVICPQPFYQLAVKANGKVTVCCADWRNELIVGDIHTETLQEIWGGKKVRAIQQAHLSGNRASLPACKDCTVLYKHPDNLDRLLPSQVPVSTQAISDDVPCS